MAYTPTKQHLDQDIPQFFQRLNTLIQQFQAQTGADDQTVSKMLASLSERYQPELRSKAGFGFR